MSVKTGVITFSDAAAMMRTARNSTRKLSRNTYLHESGPDAYAVRYHATDVVTIRRDGTYVLGTGGWDTVTTRARINSYSPARMYSEGGTMCIQDRDNDPRTPPKLQKCRKCKGTGTIHSPASYRYWDYSTTPATQLDPPVETYPASDHDCYRCSGTGQADYGSKPMPAVFHDGITVDGSGRVTGDPAAVERLHESAETVLARREAAEKARKMARRGERARWIKAHGLATQPGAVIMFKAVRADLQSDHGTKYIPGLTATASDYQPTPQCGAGLHFSPAPADALRYRNQIGVTRFLACAVDRKTMIILDDKVKARSCRVLYEVDIYGHRLAAVSTS